MFYYVYHKNTGLLCAKTMNIESIKRFSSELFTVTVSDESFDYLVK
jgi:hypothetical protein